MSLPTQQQGNVTGKKSFGQTVAQSFRVMGGANVPNYSLYFMNPTKRNRAGEHETIVIPYIEIGRASSCAVQYGDEYSTVGRKHAAIRFDNGRILLKQLHATNPTIVMKDNGGTEQLSTVGQETELKNGYQVQFSYDGPMIRVNATPTATSKMGVTQRVQLALKQGIRPYRNAVAGLAAALLVVGFLGAYIINDQAGDISSLEEENIEINKSLAENKTQLAMAESDLDSLVKSGNATKDQLDKANRRVSYLGQKISEIEKQQEEVDEGGTGGGGVSGGISGPVSKLAEFKPSIYYIYPKSVKVRHPIYTEGKVRDLVQELGNLWSGTAFLTTENKLVTARHVITPWRFPSSCNDDINLIISNCELGGSVDATYSIIAPGGEEVVNFTLGEVRMSPTEDIKIDNPCPGIQQVMKCSDNGMYTDWAWVNMNITGNIPLDRELSKQLPSGTELEIYGYSKGLALQDLRRVGLDPLYGICNVAQDGLNNKIIRVGNRPFTGGASGGPVFAKRNGKYYAVGIISHGMDNIGGIVPVTHLK